MIDHTEKRFDTENSPERIFIRQFTDKPSHVNVMREPVIPKRHKTKSAPLSFAQLQMWVMDQITPGNPAYGMPKAYCLKGQLDILALEKSFNEIIKRHEVLRTTFSVSDGEPWQVIHQECRIEVRVTRLDVLTAEERERRVHVLTSEEACVPFDLTRLPLLRVLLFKLSDFEHVLLINLHHILADGISSQLMLKELDRHYKVFTGSSHDEIPDLNIQYADFAAWQRESVATKNYVKEIAFWRQQLDGAPILELPADLQRPLVQSFKGSNIFFEIPEKLAHEVAALGAREGCTLFTTLLAAFQVLLQRYSRSEEH